MKTWTAEIWRRASALTNTWEHTGDIEIEARTESSAMNKAEKMMNPYRRVYLNGTGRTNYLETLAKKN